MSMLYGFRSNGANTIIQVAISSNFGVSWQNSTTTPPGTTPPNLSVSSEDAADPQITTDSSGRYVYATWRRKGIIQIAISSDFGVTWVNPTSTPPNTTPPDLSDSSLNADDPQIATDNTGRYVYAVWHRNNRIQIAISSDHGKTWSNPTSTLYGSPTLSKAGPPGGRPIYHKLQ